MVAGYFLDELTFGKRNESESKPFVGVTVYLHSSFHQSQEEKVRTAQQLIELGGGRVVPSTFEGEPTYRLVSREHGKTKNFDLTWQELLRLLMGEQELNQSRKMTPQPSAKKRLRLLPLSEGGDDKK